MACVVQDQPLPQSNLNKEVEEPEEVTFLYKLCHGSSPRSYGINVARLAGLPAYVLALAQAQSKRFEHSMQQQQVLSSPHFNLNSIPRMKTTENGLNVHINYTIFEYFNTNEYFRFPLAMVVARPKTCSFISSECVWCSIAWHPSLTCFLQLLLQTC